MALYFIKSIFFFTLSDILGEILYIPSVNAYREKIENKGLPETRIVYRVITRFNCDRILIEAPILKESSLNGKLSVVIKSSSFQNCFKLQYSMSFRERLKIFDHVAIIN